MKLKKRMQVVTAAVFCLFLYGFGIAHILLPDRDLLPGGEPLPPDPARLLLDGAEGRGLHRGPGDLSGGPVPPAGRVDRPEDPVRVCLLGKREFGDETRGIVYLCGDKLISKVEESDRAQQNIDYLWRSWRRRPTSPSMWP